MKRTKKMNTVLIVIGILIALVFTLYTYYGGFTTIKCRVEKQGGEILVYKEMKGDYSKSGKLMNDIYYSLLNEYGVNTFKGFGIYYDNPQKVEKHQLRSEIGCIIEDSDSSKVTMIKEKFHTKVFPTKSYVVAEFPNKGKLSIFMGIMKVYPALAQFVKANGYKDGAIMEIYDVPNHKTIYRQDILN